MITTARRIFSRTLVWVLLTPLAVFLLLMVLLYIPPVQRFATRRAAAVVSRSTDFHVSMERLELQFPLNLVARKVMVTHTDPEADLLPDTLFRLGSADVRVNALPLWRGCLDVKELTVEDTGVNTGRLLDGLQVVGQVGRFSLVGRNIDLPEQYVLLNELNLTEAHLSVVLSDTTTTAKTETASTPWRVDVESMVVRQVDVALEMPADSVALSAWIGQSELGDAHIDLGTMAMGWERFSLSNSKVACHVGHTAPALGFDPRHVVLTGVNLKADSVRVDGRNMSARLYDGSFSDRSGLSVNALEGRLRSDEERMDLSGLRLLTPHSRLKLNAQMPWMALLQPGRGGKDAIRLGIDASLGRGDVFLYVGDSLARKMSATYPLLPLEVSVGVDGSMDRLALSQLTVRLPDAFSLNGNGWLAHATDSLQRSGKLELTARTQSMAFLSSLMGDGVGVSLPDSMNLTAQVGIERSRLTAQMALDEAESHLTVEGGCHLATEHYEARVGIDTLQLHHFLPGRGVYTLRGLLSLDGQGFDVRSPSSVAHFQAAVDELLYKDMDVGGVNVEGTLAGSVLRAHIESGNSLLALSADASLRTDTLLSDVRVDADVAQVDLWRLGLIRAPLPRPFAFRARAVVQADSAQADIWGGDMELRLKSLTSMDRLIARAAHFGEVLRGQVERRSLDHAELRAALPAAGVRFRAGRDNPVSDYLKTRGISFGHALVNYGFTPRTGINGRAFIRELRADTLRLDSLYLNMQQDTSRLAIQSGVVNSTGHQRNRFSASLVGDIRTSDAQLDFRFLDAKGQTGFDMGLNATPLLNGGRRGRANGMLLRLTPEHPVVAYRQFSCAEGKNWVYLHQDKRVYAGIDMVGDDGLGFHLNSDMNDSVSLQNIRVELSRLKLSELTDALPFLPRLDGLLSVDAAFRQTEASMQFSTEAVIDGLDYEQRRVGDIGMGLTWLPGTGSLHYIDSYLTLDQTQVVTASGVIKNDSLELTAGVEHLPLRVADAFVPDGLFHFLGDIDGAINLFGSLDAPQLDGQVVMDSVRVVSPKTGANYLFDSRPLKIADNRMLFDRFAIYTGSVNPFLIDGVVDFRDVYNPQANLTLKADKYTLLDAPKTRESILFGKVIVGMDATVRGPLNGLTMRGQMNVLGDTNATYVMANSPLLVEDRLNGLVSFISFNDTILPPKSETHMTLGGLDMLMNVHIDNAVRMRANLAADGSKYVELVGGGDLSMQYTSQGDLSLMGRYTLTGGTMKYSIPIIPLKEFAFAQGSYVDWRGDVMNPRLNLVATERLRASVSDGGGSSRRVDFDVSVSIKEQLESPVMGFDIAAPNDGNVQNELQSMAADERAKVAITMLATGIYMGGSGGSGGNLTMGSALNSVLQSQINSLAGSVTNASFNVGIEDRNTASGQAQTDYTFRYSQRFFNDRVQINIGGKVSTGSNAANNVESFIDNVSMEYRLDAAGTRYVRAFHNKNYENILEGEITETGVGFVYRKKMDRLSELFLFWKRRPDKTGTEVRDAIRARKEDGDDSEE